MSDHSADTGSGKNADKSATTIRIEVAYARPEQQELLALDVNEGTTAIEAVRASGIPEIFPDLDIESARLGIFGKLCPPDRVLNAGDRVEIYRPLKADPKEVRRRLAAEGRTMGKATGGK